MLSEWAWLVGHTPLPPLWSLGYQQSRYSYYPESEVRNIAKHLRADHIPADVIWLDIDYQQDNRPFTVDRERFPHFEQMVKDLAAENFTHRGHHRPAHRQAAECRLQAVRQRHGGRSLREECRMARPTSAWCGRARRSFPTSRRRARATGGARSSRTFVKDGVAGFWNDMNEPAIFEVPSKTMPDDVQHRIDEPGFRKRTANHLEIHNVYGMENTRATYDGLATLQPNVRPFVMTRASYAGGQRYAATWTGDNSSTWNHLRMTTPMLGTSA